MRFSGYRKMVAITAAVSMLVGTGAFSVFAENENTLMQSESEDLHAPHSDAGQSYNLLVDLSDGRILR